MIKRILTLLLVCAVGLLLVQCGPESGQNFDGQPTIILISIDGFRWDYMEKTGTPNLSFLAQNGIRARSLIPSFPTKTFPNHYTIVTGLYPGNHGIVANNMYDPHTKEYFKLSLRDAVRDAEWWGGEPIWVTAEKQGLITAPYFWPGSEAKIKGIRPTYWSPYDGDVPNEERVKQVLKWLDLPRDERPVFITTYFSILDEVGHDYEPNSPEVVETIQYVDSVIGILLDGLRERDILNRVNIIVVSDHGMAEISPERVIYLDDYIDMEDVQMVDWNPVAAINPEAGKEEDVYQKLKHAHPHMQVYRKREIPERFHYRDHPHIPKILAIADVGWSITSHETVRPHQFRGSNHGFDNRARSMGTLFIAHGPAFKSGLVVDPFQNIHLYELMAKILEVPPAPNDGSLDSVKVMLK